MEVMLNDVDLASVFSTLYDISIIVIDTEGTVLFVNRSTNEYPYLDVPIQKGLSFFDCLPPSNKHITRELVDKLIVDKNPFRANIDKIGSDGLKVHFELRYAPMFGMGDQVTQVLIEARDISPEKIFANKMGRVSSDLSNLIEHANALIMGTDTQGYITEWNEMSHELTGYDKRQALAMPFAELLIEKDRQSDFSKALKLVLNGYVLNNHELEICSKDGKKLTLLIGATPRRTEKQDVDGVLFVGQDISELIAYRISLEEKVNERTSELNVSKVEIEEQRDAIDQERKKSDQLLRNILPEYVARELRERGHVAPKHFPSATILFADLAGFTTLTKGLSPAEILYELNYIFVGLDMIVEKYGLEKIKTIGDGYLAVSGLFGPDTTHALNAVKAGLEIVAFVERVRQENQKTGKPSWQMRVGIHSGELIAGVIGRNKFTYDIWGTAVNIASRMESAGVAGCVNISKATHQLVGSEVKCETRGSVGIKNMGQMEMFLVEELIATTN